MCKNIYVDICFFQSLKDKPDKTIPLINKVLNETEQLFSNFKLVKYFYVMDYKWQHELFSCTKKSLSKLDEMITKEEVKEFVIQYRIKKDQPILFSFTISFDPAYKDHLYDTTPSSIRFSINEDIIKNNTSLYLEKVTNLFKDIYLMFGNGIGFIDLSYANANFHMAETTYETSVNISINDICETKSRGYFWANILGPKHIEDLGGLDYVLANCPGFKIERLQYEDATSLYICLSESIFNLSEDKLNEFKNFISNILPYKDLSKVEKRSIESIEAYYKKYES